MKTAAGRLNCAA